MIRCNMCFRYFDSEDDLALLKDNDGYFKGCPDCKTDAYLMDIDQLKKTRLDNIRAPLSGNVREVEGNK